ncbi:hypothetical protein Pcar_0458 [Syntrophotalea carbinolica DSM 2380]|uniref:Uncharacterized protein n=1 Tax=Syntrophotalea carbinolica (strain DSM 2380 / NBRC 103641 / GraBd1) TaxID=338963 RepID=Q3A7C6_SYNC1|nr:hypothetical protein [Syntrophotalea carbinolica]ABA87718.1 hypothetical protein Pcar_0458 [Syntrophotalea carbinolica DSM 2380]
MSNINDILRHHKRATLAGLLLVLVAGVALLMAGIVGFREKTAHLEALQQLNAHLASMPPDEDHQASLDELKQVILQGKTLGVAMPEAEYARLWQQWQLAVRHFKQINAMLGNRYLAAEQRQQLQTFHSQLLSLRDRCAANLDSMGMQPGPQDWKLLNLKGNVSVMLAYSVLNFEQDGRKAAKFLSDAIDDYKSSIDLVDRTSSSTLDRSLPRWNMELIVGLGEYRKIGLSEIRQENMSEVQEQLEAFIPDVAGFAPGVPLETRVEK